MNKLKTIFQILANTDEAVLEQAWSELNEEMLSNEDGIWYEGFRETLDRLIKDYLKG